MTTKQLNWFKTAAIACGLVVSIFTIITYVNSGVDSRIDNKIKGHEAEFEMKQQEVTTKIKTDIATLKEQGVAQQRQLNVIQEQGRHTQELVEQLIRER